MLKRALARAGIPKVRLHDFRRHCPAKRGGYESRVQLVGNQISFPGISAGSIPDYAHSHYAEDLNNKLLAEKFNYHPNYICPMIAALPINEISRKDGCKSTRYFSHRFKQCAGHPPREFQIE